MNGLVQFSRIVGNMYYFNIKQLNIMFVFIYIIKKKCVRLFNNMYK